MAWTAGTTTTEEGARRLAEALGEDALLGSLPLDAFDTAPGRWQLTVYFPGRPGADEMAALARLARAALGAGAAFAVAPLPEADWVAKSLEGLAPVRVGRFLVHGSHDRGRRRPNNIAIEIEAGQAFGTGHHGTTAGCLAAIERLAGTRRIRRALDVGTGSGVLAIAIARRCRAPVLASDIDPVAVRIAQENARLNGVAPLVRTVLAAGIDRRRFAAAGPFDLIVANILAGPLVALAPSIRRRLAPGGTAVLSGLLPAQANRVAAACRGQGLRLLRNEVRDGWTTLTFRRDRPSRRREPAQMGKRPRPASSRALRS